LAYLEEFLSKLPLKNDLEEGHISFRNISNFLNQNEEFIKKNEKKLFVLLTDILIEYSK
jgi:hypothetical protein